MSSKSSSRSSSISRRLAQDVPASSAAGEATAADAELPPVRVFARFRPMNQKELDIEASQCVQFDANGTNVELTTKSAGGAGK